MKRKVISTLFALVLMLSLGLVMGPAAVIGQGASNYAEYTLVDGGGTAEWSKEGTPPSGEYSAKLYDGGVADQDGSQVVIPGVNIPFTEIASLSYWFNYTAAGGSAAEGQFAFPYMILAIDKVGGDPPYTADEWIVLHSGGDPYQPAEGEWVEWSLDGEWDKWFDAEGTTIPDFSPLADFQGEYEDAVVMDVKVAVGEGWAVGVTAFVDDVEINGVTYDLQPPIFLDDSYYQVDDIVTVTVFDAAANTNSAVQESVAVDASINDPANSIMLGLLETGVDTSVFTETFTLVSTTPGTGELLVTQGSEVTVTYDGLTDTAIVDSVAPVVEITAPLDGEFVAGAVVTIEGTISDSDTWSLEIDGVVVDTGIGASVSYDWDTTLEVDGTLTIELLGQDLAELVGSDSIDVTVDNTLPEITDQSATPPVIEPNIEKTIVFTADVTELNIDTVTIDLNTIGGDSDTAMLDDGVSPDATPDDGKYTANITTTIATETTYYLPVTATDLAGLSVATIGEDRLELVVSSDIVPPVITAPAITYPFVGVNSAQPSEVVTISATVIDADSGVDTVTAACDVITGGVTLYDDGTNGGDVTADDNIYTGEGTVDGDAGWGDFTVTITATDAKGNVATDTTLELVVRYGATAIDIDLVVGWNLISLPLIPDTPAIGTMLASISDKVDVVWGYDSVNSPDDPWAAYVPGIIEDDLTEIVDGMGYWVYMNELATLTITGTEMPVPNGAPTTPPTYDVVEGWNLIGVKNITPEGIALEDYLINLYEEAPLLPQFSVIWGYDAVAGSYFNVYPLGAEMLFPSQGYWLWMSTDGTIVPPQ